MRPSLGLSLAAALLLSGPAHAQTAPPAIPDSLPPGVTAGMILRGAEIFRGPGGCVTCHGVEARGLLGPDLTDDDWWHAKGSYLELVNQVLRGVPAQYSRSGVAMEPRGGAPIDDAQVQAVAAFVWRVSHPEARDSLPAGVTAEMVELGRSVFRGVGGCARCHGADATGEQGPNLTDEEWLHAKGSYLAIFQTILTGVPQERSRTGVVMPPRGGGGISDQDVHDVAAFVWALSRPSAHR